ncbi:TetR/AcrR family transcriptional regulator C-terminal domain-containing protein [Nocardiopsis rhodophaea]|uniref:TetR/AcrR family transcriptional regulator C-terminal domain-containing protein n=1 Tax=Nocardiopsis rhodophaea TaxID=280238 RepID=A0ABP5F4K8_9ACTN
MGPQEEERNRGGRPPRLTLDDIVRASEKIVRREGANALTMRRLAKDLDASPMAMYRHVADKDQLLVLVLDRIVAHIERPELPQDPRGRLMVLWQLLHSELSTRPWAVEVLVAGDVMAPSVMWLVEDILSAFVDAGLDHTEAATAYRAVWQYTIGEIIVHTSTDQRTAELTRSPHAITMISKADQTTMPHLAHLADQWTAARKSNAYPVGLSAMVDGFIGSRS